MNRYHVGSLIVIAALALAVAFMFLADAEARSDREIAEAIVKGCADAERRDACYEQDIPALMDGGLSMDRAYAITRIVQDLDQDYHYCHVLAHNISAKEAARDLSKWKDVVARSPSGMCGNGGLHGAFQERFRAQSFPDATPEELREEFEGVCDPRDGWQPTHIEHASCMHGLGHLAMFVTDADILKSAALCELMGRSGDEDFRQTCLDGVFMQIFQPLEPEDEALVEEIVPTAAERSAFCAAYHGLAYVSCIKESWPLYLDTIRDPAGFAALCGPLQGDQEGFRYCASGSVYVLFGLLQYDVKAVMRICDELDGELGSICVSRSASRFVETDWENVPQALGVCAGAAAAVQDACYQELSVFAKQGMPRGSEAARALCGGMPDRWRVACEENTGL